MRNCISLLKVYQLFQCNGPNVLNHDWFKIENSSNCQTPKIVQNSDFCSMKPPKKIKYLHNKAYYFSSAPLVAYQLQSKAFSISCWVVVVN